MATCGCGSTIEPERTELGLKVCKRCAFNDIGQLMAAEFQREVDEEIISLMVKAHEEALIEQQKNRDEAAEHLDGIEGLLDF